MIVTKLFCAACLGGFLLANTSHRADSPARAARTPADAVNLTATATAIATADDADTPLAASAASDPFYDPRVVQTIHLEIKTEDLDRMRRALPKRLTVPGAFRWNESTIERVGIRYKGNSSSSPNAHHKRSFLISFSEFDKDQRFLGLRHAALDNAIQFGSVFSEPLITEMLRELGVKASRCNYSRVHLNGQYAGVYVNVERIDRSFLERSFGAAHGPLLKVDEGGPGADLRFLGDDPALYGQAFELHDGDRAKAYAGLIELIRTVNDPAVTEADLRRRFDIDSFLTVTAVLLFSGAFDQYTGWAPHNYYLHQNAIDGRWSYLPWDLDVGFADKAFGRVPVLRGWHAAWPAPVPGRPLMERVISNATLLEQYRRKATAILETHFQPARLIPKLRALHQQIKPDLDKDPFPPRRVTVPADSSYSDIVDSIEAFIRERYELARAQLDQPGPRPIYTPMETARKDGGPKPGPPSTDAPTDLRLVKVTASRVEMRWTDHAEGEVAFVVQKCLGPGETDFVNAIGQGGADIATATDPDVQPGKTYRYRVYAVLPTPQGPRGTGVSNVLTVQVPAE